MSHDLVRSLIAAWNSANFVLNQDSLLNKFCVLRGDGDDRQTVLSENCGDAGNYVNK